MRMGVLQLGPYPPPEGGIQTHLVALRRFLLARDIPCAAINLTRFRKVEGDGLYYPRSGLGVGRLLLRLPHPIIHLHIGGHVTRRLLGLSLFCSLLPRRRTVLTLHSGGYPSSPAGRAASPRTLCGFVFRRLDRVVAVNPAIAELFDRFGVDANRVRVISPFAMPEPAPATTLPDRLRDFFVVHRPLLVTVSGLEPEYDLPLQVDVLGGVLERFPKAGLVILGSGSLEERLRAYIGAKPYAESVLLYGDAPHAATVRAIAEGDLLLRTTWYDGDSISVREGLHLGTPVIATDNGMRPQEVQRIPARDPTALLNAIMEQLTRRVPPRQPPTAGSDGNLQAVLDLYAELAKEVGV